MADGRESLIALFAQGEAFAEAVMFLGSRISVSGATVEKVTGHPGRAFPPRSRSNNELCFKMMASMAIHLRHLVVQVEQLTVRTSTERIGQFLLELARGLGAERARAPPLRQGVAGGSPRHAARDMPGAGQAAAARRQTRGSRVTIRDIDALRRHCAGTQCGGLTELASTIVNANSCSVVGGGADE